MIYQIGVSKIRDMQKKENNQTQAAIEFQSIVRNNVRMILARFPQKQESFASALQMSQASISKKLNGKADWTSADIANAAVYFGLPFYVLVSPTALKDYLFTDPEAEYQLGHNVPTDISRRELAASAVIVLRGLIRSMARRCPISRPVCRT